MEQARECWLSTELQALKSVGENLFYVFVKRLDILADFKQIDAFCFSLPLYCI